MALGTDHRPETLKELHGNAALKQSLASKLKLSEDKRPHVYLFTGNKGCGKTTLARIVANTIGCHKSEFNELDASDESGGVAAVRELKRQIHYSPMAGDVRVWFADEAHKISKAGQEAFLKMLEEPPDHAYFIFATTDPQKLLPTFKDRCATFEVKPLDEEEMEEFLHEIIEAEEKEVPQAIIEHIVEASQGLPRQAIRILERVIDLPAKQMLASAQQTAETEAQTIDLCRALLNPKVKWSEIAKILSTITGEPESIRYAVLGYCNAILLKGDNKRAYLVMSCFTEPYYNLSKSGLTLSCYEAVCGG